MARRSRDRRLSIPGYDELRPRRDDRAHDHRKVRHAASQMLRTVADPEELAPLPEVRSDHHLDRAPIPASEIAQERFDVGKTKFWKRRAQFKSRRATLDSRWGDPERGM